MANDVKPRSGALASEKRSSLLVALAGRVLLYMEEPKRDLIYADEAPAPPTTDTTTMWVAPNKRKQQMAPDADVPGEFREPPKEPDITLEFMLSNTWIDEEHPNGSAPVALCRHCGGWLDDEYCDKLQPLVRRQLLPPEALLSDEEALALLESEEVCAISYGWLAKGHPDPDGKRRPDVSKIPFDYVFWDFLSLYQVDEYEKRTAREMGLFNQALKGMHLIYGHAKWAVCRILTVPPDAANPTPYERRGWAFFESNVAHVGARTVWNYKDGEDVTEIQDGQAVHVKSLVPLTPEKFHDKVRLMKFTSPRADVRLVSDLYYSIFQRLAVRETAYFHNWEDAEIYEFLEMLPQIYGLKSTNFVHSTATEEARKAMDAAMLERGGTCLWDGGLLK